MGRISVMSDHSLFWVLRNGSSALLYPRIVLYFLFLSGVLFVPLNEVLSPKIYYAFIFLIWMMVYVIFLSFDSKINSFILMSLVVLFSSTLIGGVQLASGVSNAVDLMADVTRFFAPFLGYGVALMLYRTIELDAIYKIVSMFIILEIYYIAESVFLVIWEVVIRGGGVVKYGGSGIESSVVLLAVVVVMLFTKRWRGSSIWILFACLIVLLLMYPLSIASKTLFIVSIVQALVLMLLLYQLLKVPGKILLVVVSGIFLMIPFFHMGDSLLGERFINFYDYIDGSVVENDDMKSSSARIGEIKGVLANVDNEPYTIFFGSGNGAWIESKYIDEKESNSGLSHNNFRGYGEYVHHVHSGLFAIFNRNGIFGVLVYVLFFVYLMREVRYIWRNVVESGQQMESSVVFLCAYSIGLGMTVLGAFVAIFPSQSIYGAIGWGASVALISVIKRRLQVQARVY